MGRRRSGREGLGRMSFPAGMPEPLSLATAAFGARVRARREALGLSQEALAREADLHWTFVGQVERGRRNISLNNILKLAAGLGIDPAELVAGLKPPEG
jgi:transcriptional regulator with XRE-family HTH domain